VVGVEPSEVYTLCDEYLDLLPDDEYIKHLAERAYTFEEYLIQQPGDGKDGVNYLMRVANNPHQESMRNSYPIKKQRVLYHAHCYQKARKPASDGKAIGAQATIEFLRSFGYETELVEAGCCGMAGAFGYEAEHYELSMQVGELALFPAVRQAGQDTLIAASGVSCQAQIEDGAGRKAVHPLELAVEALRLLRTERLQ
jgi:Fe-S oxidoreductase